MAKISKSKILGVCGSPRDRNTACMLKTVLAAAGPDHELILLKDKNIRPCRACGGCFHTHKCVVDDDMQELYAKLTKADIVVLGSPTYFGNVTGLMKNFMDRCLPLYLAEKLKGKKAALLTVGNFRKGEARFLDGFDIEVAMNDPAQRKALAKPIKKCLAVMESFCRDHMMMRMAGKVMAINSDPKSKNKELVKLGRKLCA